MYWEVIVHKVKNRKYGKKNSHSHRFPTKAEAERFGKQFMNKLEYRLEMCKITKMKGF